MEPEQGQRKLPVGSQVGRSLVPWSRCSDVYKRQLMGSSVLPLLRRRFRKEAWLLRCRLNERKAEWLLSLIHI